MEFSENRYFLVGMMGSGKSFFGRLWSQQSGRPLFDTDHLIEQKAGKTISELFAEPNGESAFRLLEATLIRNPGWPKECYISCGGGLPCFNDNMNFMLSLGKVVWLNPPVDVLVNRLWNQRKHRPLVAGMKNAAELEVRLKDLLSKRVEVYKKANIMLPVAPDSFKDLDVL